MIIKHVLNQNSILNKFIVEIRDKKIQKDSFRFRMNIERIGEILSYEMSKTLNYKTESIKTPLGNKKMQIPEDNVVIASILRAGLPLHMGILKIFDNAENAFISAYRKNNADDFSIQVDYIATPKINRKILILADPMLATGKSLVTVYERLKKIGLPKQLHVISIIGSKQGINYINDKLPENSYLWIADFDNKLNNKNYIVPGLGDAGDLSFGKKI